MKIGVGPLVELILYGKPDCDLCDRLEAMVKPLADVRGLTLVKRNIEDGPSWVARYRYRIPVLTCGDQVILEGRPKSDDVAHALEQL